MDAQCHRSEVGAPVLDTGVGDIETLALLAQLVARGYPAVLEDELTEAEAVQPALPMAPLTRASSSMMIVFAR
ncbi:MAG: hypothetical protein ACRDTT_12660 [Pseudonocardiaceae bacterium]